MRCNVLDFSAVISAAGQVRPCFFIPGPAPAPTDRLPQVLNSDSMTALRSGDSRRSAPGVRALRLFTLAGSGPPHQADFLMRRNAHA